MSGPKFKIIGGWLHIDKDRILLSSVEQYGVSNDVLSIRRAQAANDPQYYMETPEFSPVYAAQVMDEWFAQAGEVDRIRRKMLNCEVNHTEGANQP